MKKYLFIALAALALPAGLAAQSETMADSIPMPSGLLVNGSQERLAELQREYFPVRPGSFITERGDLTFTSDLTFSYLKKYIGQDLLRGTAGRDVYLLSSITGTPGAVLEVWCTWFEPGADRDRLVRKVAEVTMTHRLGFVLDGVEHEAYLLMEGGSNVWRIGFTWRFR